MPQEQSIRFADNLQAQTTDEFKISLHDECNTRLRLLPPDTTDELQPVDAGYERLLKVEAGKKLDKWLGYEENLPQWETNAFLLANGEFFSRRLLERQSHALTQGPRIAFAFLKRPGWQTDRWTTASLRRV